MDVRLGHDTLPQSLHRIVQQGKTAYRGRQTRERIIVFEEILKMKAMPVEEAKPRTTFCIWAKKHLKGERLFYKRFAFFRIKAHRNKNNTHTFVYAAKGCAMGRKLRRCAGVAANHLP